MSPVISIAWARELANIKWRFGVREDGESRVRVRVKGLSKLMSVIAFLLRPLDPDFLENHATTIGRTIYVPWQWWGTRTGAVALRHEAVHVTQYERWGVLFCLGYLLFPLPAFFTLRARWELEAYRAEMQAVLERDGEIGEEFLNALVALFCGPTYFWMSTRARAHRMVYAAADEIQAQAETESWRSVH